MGIEFWQDKWEGQDIPWDLGKPHSLLTELHTQLMSVATKPCLDVYVPGCGTGHDAAYLAQAGHQVTATDIVSSAIEVAHQAYGKLEGLTLKVGDALQSQPDELNAFDLIYNRAVLCIFPPKLQEKYVRVCTQRLRSGGLWAGIVMTQFTRKIEGPPFLVTRNELEQLFSANFKVLLSNPRTDGSLLPFAGEETLFIARKK